MGYSCTAAAADVERAWSVQARLATGCMNQYRGTDGIERFWEIGREQRDGAIVGMVYPLHGGHTPSRSFRIEPDGTVTRKPPFWPWP